MFGYVRAYKPELKCREYDEYKAVYCSLCRALGRRYGPLAQIALTYDGTFLALLRMALKEKCAEIKQSHCVYNPLKKCGKCDKRNEDINYAADASVILFYYKLKDNISDKGFFKKIVSVLLLLPFFLMKRKAAESAPETDLYVSQAMQKQHDIETNHDNGFDISADPSATALGKIFSLGSKDKIESDVLYELGYHIGRWVYIIDAADDFYSDVKKSCFNPLKKRFKASRSRSESEELIKYVSALLQMSAGEAINAFELLDCNCYGDIVKNILYDGLHNSMLYVFKSLKDGIKE